MEKSKTLCGFSVAVLLNSSCLRPSNQQVVWLYFKLPFNSFILLMMAYICMHLLLAVHISLLFTSIYSVPICWQHLLVFDTIHFWNKNKKIARKLRTLRKTQDFLETFTTVLHESSSPNHHNPMRDQLYLSLFPVMWISTRAECAVFWVMSNCVYVRLCQRFWIHQMVFS